MTIVLPLEWESENRNKLNLQTALTQDAKGQGEGVDRLAFWLLGFFKWKKVINLKTGSCKVTIGGVGDPKLFFDFLKQLFNFYKNYLILKMKV